MEKMTYLTIQQTLETLQIEAEALQKMISEKQILFVLQQNQILFPEKEVMRIRMDKMASPTIKIGRDLKPLVSMEKRKKVD